MENTKISLIDFFNHSYNKSALQKANRNNPIPHKFIIDGMDCYFYNPDLSGLISISEIIIDQIKPSDFLSDYKKGFMEGLKYLKTLGIKTKSFNNPTKIEYLTSRICFILYEKEYSILGIGLIKQINLLPLIWIKDKQIFDAGYYNGVLHSINNISNETGINFTGEDFQIASEGSLSQKHPAYDPNLWNEECYELFKYIYNEYNPKSKREFTNIWFYLKDYTSQKYILIATKDRYKEFILNYYKITIKNFDKAAHKWEVERSRLDGHRIIFEKKLHQP